MIIRVEKTKNYTVMSNYHLREKNMSLKAKGLLSWMLSNNDDWDYSIAGIVKNCKENETAITSTLQELIQFGYLERHKLMPESFVDENGNRVIVRDRIEYEYVVHEQPIQNQEVENLGVENPVQRNTNRRNTKKENNTIPNGIVEQQRLFSQPKDDSDTEELTDFEKHMFSDDVKQKRKIAQAEDKPKQKRMSLWDKCVQYINEYTEDSELRDALTEYLKIRLSMKNKPIFAGQWKALLNKLDIFDDKLAVVKQSLELGYASFYELKTGYRGSVRYTPNPSVFGENEHNQSIKVSKAEREEILKNGTKF